MRREPHFFTIIAKNYVAQATVLGRSLRQVHGRSPFSVFVMDDTDGDVARTIRGSGWQAMAPEDLPIPDFRKRVFQYTLVEACTSVKPAIMQLLFERGEETVIYLDPDTYCFQPFDHVLDCLRSHDIALTPHCLGPRTGSSFVPDRLFLRYGTFNLGFIAARNGEGTAQFLEWWSARLATECRARPDLNLYVDQRWLDLAPAYFPLVHVVRHPGYNVGWWNLDERFLSRRDGVWTVEPGGEPLVFFHFSGFPLSSPDAISSHLSGLAHETGGIPPSLESREDLRPIFDGYAAALVAASEGHPVGRSYSFAHFDRGEAITDAMRELVLEEPQLSERCDDPFRSRSLRSLLQRAGFAKANGPESSQTETALSADRLVQRPRLHSRVASMIARTLIATLGLGRAERIYGSLNHQFRLARHEARRKMVRAAVSRRGVE